MRRLTAMALFAAALAAAPIAADAQVLRELDPIELEYGLYWGTPKQLVGEAIFSFAPVDTKRGRRLEINATIRYSLPRETPFDYEEESKLICDKEGITRFETEARALGQERLNVGIRVGDEFHVTTTFGGTKRDTTIPSDVRRSNLALFAGAFLAEPLDKDDMLRDYPLLYPVAGGRKPRQKYREAILPFSFGDGQKMVRSIKSRVKHLNETSDYYWNAVEGHQILLRMEEISSLGSMIYELASVNGVPPLESELIR